MKETMKKFGAWLLAAYHTTAGRRVAAAMVCALAFAGSAAMAADYAAKTEDGTTYASLADALAAVTKDNALTEVSEEAWPVSTPVYYNGKFHATMSDAIFAACVVNSDKPALIYVRPYFSFGGKGFTHDLLKTSITIYGNNASIGTSWQPSLELPGTPESAANGWHQLTKDVSHAFYNIHDGLGVWGTRCTDKTITVTMENCNNVYECWCMYGSGYGQNNFIVRNCTFTETAAVCAVTTQNGGSLTVENCSFKDNAQSVITANVKQSGNQVVNVVVKNCTFENVGESASKGGLRLQTTQPSTINLTAEGLMFTGVNKSEVTLGDAKALAEGCAINYTITKSTGKLNAFDEPEVTMVESETYGNVVVAPAVAKIGTTEYETLGAAFAAAKSGDTVELLAASYGENDLTDIGKLHDKNVIVVGLGMDKTELKVVYAKNGSDVNGLHFQDLTLTINHSGYGMPYTQTLCGTYERVKFNGLIAVDHGTSSFTDCVFTGTTTGDEYILWQYGGVMLVERCTFEKSASKGIVKLYCESSYEAQNLVKDCVFLSVTGSKGCAIYASNSNNLETPIYEMNIVGNTIPDGVAEYLASGDGLTVVNPVKDATGKFTSGTFISGNANKGTVADIISGVLAENCAIVLSDDCWTVGVKITDETIITTKPQESKVEVPTEVVQDEEVAEKIEQSTKVEGVKLSATADEGKTSGIVAVVEEAKKDETFAAAVAAAAEVSVKVEVEVKPTAYDNTADKGKVAFKLTPKATVTVVQEEKKLEQVVPVTNDMIDQNQKIAVSIYTGFAPATILHNDDNGALIESFGGEQIVYNAETGVATVQISHFSTLLASQEEIDPYIEQGYTKVADGFYQSGATYTASAEFYIVNKAGLGYFRDFVNNVNGEANVYAATAVGAGFDVTSTRLAGKTVKLLADIDLNNEVWTPIGRATDKDMLGGTFDGNNHVVSNLKTVYATDGKDQAGFFGYSNKPCTIQNLTLRNVDIKGLAYVGAVISTASSSDAKIVNCHVIGSVSIEAAGNFVGGIVGHGQCSVSNCSVEATSGKGIDITGGGIRIGGIYGYAASNTGVVIENCSVSNLKITLATNYIAGGIVGSIEGGATVRRCSVENLTIDSKRGPYVGYIVGNLASQAAVSAITDCTAANSTLIGRTDKFTEQEETYTVQNGDHDCPSAYYVGSGVSVDKDGKVTGGTFEYLPNALVAEGFEPKTDPETGKIVVGEAAKNFFVDANDANLWHVANAAGLAEFRDAVNGGNTFAGKTVVLEADIDLASVENWAPIGNFLGTFDGQGMTIDNLTGEHGLFTGLTAHPDAGTSTLIKNFTLDHVRMASTGNDVGAVAGTSGPGVTIENVHVKNGYVSGSQYVGGIVGHWYATITDCSYEGEVYGMQAGGIAGSGGFVISNCKFVGTVDGYTWVGGICGQFQDGDQMVKDCYVEGTVSADVNYYGAGAAGIVSVPSNPNAEISGNYCNMVAENGGEPVECPIIGGYNEDTAGATFPNLKNNSWNMEKYTITELSVTELAVDDVRAVVPRNNNLVGSVKDLEYVGSGVVEIAAGSDIAGKTAEEIKAEIVAADPTKTVEIVEGKVVVTEAVAMIGETGYATLAQAFAAAAEQTGTAENPVVIQLMAGTIEEGEITLPDTIKDVTVKGATDHASILRNTTLAHRTNGKSWEGLTIEGIDFESSSGILIVGWGAGNCFKNVTIKDNIFRNFVNADNNAPIHFNVGEKLDNIVISGNLIDGVSGSLTSGICFTTLDGSVTISGNTIKNVAWDAIQAVPTAGAEVTITGNTFDFAKTDQKRGIHLQSSGVVDYSATIENNVFLGALTGSSGGALEVYYFADPDKMDVSGNYYSDTQAIALSCVSSGMAAGNATSKIYPIKANAAFDDTTLIYKAAAIDNGVWSTVFYDTLDAAIKAAGDDKLDTIKIVDPSATAPEGYEIKDGKIVKKAAYVAEIFVGEESKGKFASINAAFAAVNSQSGDDVKIMLLCDIKEALTTDYDFYKKNVTLDADVKDGVTVDFENVDPLWAITEDAGGGTMTISENVKLLNIGQIFAGYASTANVVDVYGEVQANQLWAYNGGTLNIYPLAKVQMHTFDGMIRLRSNGTVNITGNGKDEVQFDFGYFAGDGNGENVLNLKDTFVNACWLTGDSGAFTLNLDNAKLVLGHENHTGINFADGVTGTINMTIDSLIAANRIGRIGAINIDATGIGDEPVKVFDYTENSQTLTLADYGTVTVTGGEAYVEDNDLWVKAASPYWSDHAAAEYSTPVDTDKKILTIATAEELALFAKEVTEKINPYNKYTINITKDIDLSAYEWVSIKARQENKQTSDFYYALQNAVIDGGNHAITGMKIANVGDDECGIGFLGEAMSLRIKDLTFDRASIDLDTERSQVGIVIGALNGAAMIENVHVMNSTLTAGWHSGAIIGFTPSNGNTSYIRNCTCEGVVVTDGYSSPVGTIYSGVMVGCVHQSDTVVFADGSRIKNDCSVTAGKEFIGRKIGGVSLGKMSEVDGWWYPTLADGIAAVEEDGEVELLANCAEEIATDRTTGFTMKLASGVAFTGSVTGPEGYALKDNGDRTYTYGEVAADVAEIVETGAKYPTLQAAVDAADGQTVKLLANVEENITVAEGKDLTLDFNGKTLDGSWINVTPTILNYGILTINDSSEEKTGAIKRTLGDGVLGNDRDPYYVIDNFGTMSINAANVDYASKATGQQASMMRNNGVMVINDGVFTSDYEVLKNEDNEGGTAASLTINGGTFSLAGGSITSYMIQCYGNVAINGGTFGAAIQYDNDILKEDEDATLVIAGGTFVIDQITPYIKDGYCEAIDIGANATTYTAVQEPPTDASAWVIGDFLASRYWFGGEAAANRAVDVWKADAEGKSEVLHLAVTPTIPKMIADGVYHAVYGDGVEVGSAVTVASGFEFKTTYDESTCVYTYEVVPSVGACIVRPNGEIVNYNVGSGSHVRTAASAASAGDTVKVLQDDVSATASASYFNGNANTPLTLDLNGKTIGRTASAAWKTISINKPITLTIVDGTGTGRVNQGVYVTVADGKVVIKGGIYGGDLSASNGGEIIVQGGTFYKDPTAFVDADNYDIVHNTGTTPETWTVQKKADPVVSDPEGEITIGVPTSGTEGEEEILQRPIAVTEAWVAANVTPVGEKATAAEIVAALNARQENGLKGWQNYLTGFDAKGEKKPLAPKGEKSGSDAEVVITTRAPVVPPNAKTGFKVTYVLQKAVLDANRKIIGWEDKTELAEPKFPVQTSVLDPESYWKIMTKFTPVAK